MPDVADAASTTTVDETGPSGRGVAIAVFVVLLLGVVAVVALLALRGGGGDGAETVTFVVDPGTGERLDAGEVVELMPAEVRLDVGDTIVIRNDDDRDHVVGPYFVRSGETLQQTYTRAQVLVGECQLSGEGELRVVVGDGGASS